ncbi:hypothetical protein AX16_006730 [Volvariella volvacea WC 439]|nr:hypothetical protein AX16_006730 [Volvariella volvacea WC 439]
MLPRLLLWIRVVTILFTSICAAAALVLGRFQLAAEDRHPDFDSYAIVVVCVTSLYLLSLVVTVTLEILHKTHPSALICQIVFELPWLFVLSLLFLAGCAIPTVSARFNNDTQCNLYKQLVQTPDHHIEHSSDYTYLCTGATAVSALCFACFGLLLSYSVLLGIVAIRLHSEGYHAVWRYSVRELIDVPINMSGGQTMRSTGVVRVRAPQMSSRPRPNEGIIANPNPSFRVPNRGQPTRPEPSYSPYSEVDSGADVPRIYVVPPSSISHA